MNFSLRSCTVTTAVLPFLLFASILGCSAEGSSNSGSQGGNGGAGSGNGSGQATNGSGQATNGSGMNSTGSGEAFDAGSDPNRNNVMAGQVCDRLSTIQCAGEVHCCTNPTHTYDACKQAMFSLCANDLHLDAVT